MRFWRFVPVFLLLFLLIGGFAVAGVPDVDKAQGMALRWDRDFDLLIDMKDVPTLAQKKLEQEKKILIAERDSLKRTLASLDKRLAVVNGSFSNEALVEEMLKLKEHDAASVRKTLREQKARTQQRIAEVERSLKALSGNGES